MDDQPPIDRTIILPIVIGILSIFGILIVLLVGRLSAARAALPVEETETPFKYIFLGTEPLPSVEGTAATEEELFTDIPFDDAVDTPTARPPGVTPTLGTPNTSGGPPDDQVDGPPIGNTSSANTALPTSTSASGPPLSPGTYDDVDSHLVYDGPGWEAQQVSGAYHDTLHVSTVAGSSVTFRFIGTEMRLTYQARNDLGEVTITIDNQSFPLDQSDLGSGDEWASPLLTNATHTVVITHESGGTVNLDSVIIPAIATPTPTPTPTP